MDESAPSEITRILVDLRVERAGSAEVTGRLLELVYDELRAMAAGFLRSERAGHTLQPTALVHEAFLKLVDQDRVEWQGRAHFFGIAAQAMRRILVDHARRRASAKRGGGWQRVTIDEALQLPATPEVEILELDEALEKLAVEDERAAKVVELKVFAGMTRDEIAHVVGVSPRTVDDDWALAKMWLRRELEEKGS